jgi:hypothetical protein
MNDLPPYGFRIKFHIPEYQIIDCEGESFDIQFPNQGTTFHLKSASEKFINESNSLVIMGGNFSSKQKAFDFGLKVKKILLLCGPLLDMGFDVGEDKASFILGKFAKERIKEMGYNAVDDVHGLTVFSESLQVRIISSKSKTKCYPSFNMFLENFRSLYEKNPLLSEKHTLALELFNLSFFEESHRAKFLTLITAIECLSHPRKESIYKSCKNLIINTLGMVFLNDFDLFYKIRNSLTHDGIVPQGIHLASEVVKLRKFLSNLIKKLIPECQDV